MSGFYFGRHQGDQQRLQAIAGALSFTDSTWNTIDTSHGMALIIASVDDQALWSPYRDPASGSITAIIGRSAFDAPEWDQILQADPAGKGIVCQHLWKRYRQSGSGLTSGLNGAYTVIIWEPGSHQLTLISDRLGVIPVFTDRPRGDQGPQLCSHPDVLARYSGNPASWDLTTFAEQLHSCYGTPPHSYYQDIKQLDSASLYRWDLDTGKRQQQRYWCAEFAPLYDRPRLATLLAEALTRAIQRRTLPHLLPGGVFLSGGADSRNILFAAADRSKLRGITLFDGRGNELLVAEALCKRAGIAHMECPRDLEYYPRQAAAVLRMGAGIGSFVDGHYQGYLQDIEKHRFNTVYSGCYADYLFKAVALNTRQLRIGRLRLPYRVKGRFQLEYYRQLKRMAPEWKTRAEQRLLGELDGIQLPPRNDIDELQIEARRMLPFSREVDSIARSSIWHTLPWDPPFCDNDIIAVYQQIPPKWKRNGEVFADAVAIVSAAAIDIPHASSMLPVDTSPWRKSLSALSRHYGRGHDIGGPALTKRPPWSTDGSWPDWKYIISHSAIIRDNWHAADTDQRQMFEALLGWDPWSRPLQDWATINDEYFCQIYSMSIWLRQLGDSHG